MQPLSQRRVRIAAAILIFIGAVRVAATYNVFSATADEGMHLTAGLQIWTEARYSVHYVNPPLPRVLTAAGPALAGARYRRDQTTMEQVFKVFHSTGQYKTLLALARAGTLPFFILASWATFAWARRELGDTGALLALFFFTMQPTVLAHAGLATLDVAGTAGLALSMLAFSRWLDAPSPRRAALLGAAYGFGIACKLLCIVYVPVACAAIFAVRWLRERKPPLRALLPIALVPPVALLVVWLSYGLSIGPFMQGIRDVIEGNDQGLMSYALGRTSQKGWWWYFILALAVKTTLASLLALLLGRARRAFLEPLAATAAILAFTMTTHVHIGVRYILPIYVPLSLAAAAAVLFALEHRHRLVRALAVALLLWHLGASALAHPDYLAYFNEPTARQASYFLVDSNLDWGQDLLRLRDLARREKIAPLGLSLFGSADLNLLGFPPHHHVDAWTPTQGWVAVSEGSYRLSGEQGGWTWLRGRPYRRIGKSIRLYYIE